jgi:hypothetical protein
LPGDGKGEKKKKEKQQVMFNGVKRQKGVPWNKSNSSSCGEPILSFLSIQNQ